MVLGLHFVATVVRRMIFEGEQVKQHFLLLTAFFAVLGGYEMLLLRRVNHALREEADLGTATQVLNVFVEALFPSLGIILLIATDMAKPYVALVAPVVLAYFLFVILSTLRLSPILARLTGIFSAAGYALVVGGVFLLYPVPEVRQGMQPVEFYVGNTVMILAAGLLAGGVARQIRLHVGAALREAREVERINGELETARNIQQGLLPRETPALDDYDIAGWNKPADQTGGDYYGWPRLVDGRTVLTLADVAGHGIASALMASACHAYVQATTAQESGLEAIITRLNRLLCADLPAGKLVTFVAAALDPSTARLQLLSAGHAPLLLYSSSEDKVHSFDAHGVPFGVFRGMAYGPPQEITLAAGDMLVLVTDGFFEWTNARDEDFGFDRLKDAIRAARDLPAADVISSLHKAVTQFTAGTAQPDDLTAVVLKRIR
jgi:serine phosphatase RsbU (regulator of sigma subunit)